MFGKVLNKRLIEVSSQDNFYDVNGCLWSPPNNFHCIQENIDHLIILNTWLSWLFFEKRMNFTSCYINWIIHKE